MRGWAFAVLVGCGGGSTAPVDADVVDTRVGDDARVDDAPAFDATVADASSRAAVVGGCAVVTGPHGHTAEVTNDMGYVPTATVTVNVGEVAQFAYADDGTEHTIVSGPPGAPDGLFASAPFSTHGAFTCIRFEAVGAYPIHCDRHPDGAEQGTFTVVP